MKLNEHFLKCILLHCSRLGLAQKFKVLLFLNLILSNSAIAMITNVNQHGAIADCITLNDQAFVSAFNFADTVDIPSGCYGISRVNIPNGKMLRGISSNSKLASLDSLNNYAIYMHSQSKVFNIKLETSIQSSKDGIKLGEDGINIEVQNTNIIGFRFGVHADNVNRNGLPCKFGALIKNCNISNTFTGIQIDYSRNVKCISNTITGSKRSAILAWGNYSDSNASPPILPFTSMLCSDIELVGNTAIQSAQAAEGIWATGCNGVLISNNYVENALDVGIDLEWVHNGTIINNISKNAVNGCIALFFACKNVLIKNNTIHNGHNIQSLNTNGWWASAGIWLTNPNRGDHPNDYGHQDIKISGNNITCSTSPGFERNGIWVGNEVGEVQIFSNTYSSECKLRYGDPRITFSGNVIINEGLLSNYTYKKISSFVPKIILSTGTVQP